MIVSLYYMKKACTILRSLMSVSIIVVMPGCVNNIQSHHIIKGTYIWGPEVREFTACDGSHSIWAEGNRDVMELIINAVIKKSRKENSPWQPVYVEMEIKKLNDIPSGFAEAYSERAEITNVFYVSENIPMNCITGISEW
ncbi:hypothetical protein RCN52_01825 [Escherichia marmotae]|nr:hypothetical protein [Escherichia marmotae]